MEAVRNIPTLDDLNKGSRELSDRLSVIESRLGIVDDIQRASDDVRRVYLQIQNLERRDDDPELKRRYENILQKYKAYEFAVAESVKGFEEATRELIINLQSLVTKDGKHIEEVEIDGGYMEALNALVQGMIKAKDSVIKELEETWDLVTDKEQRQEMYDSIVEALSDPQGFILTLLEYAKTEVVQVYEDFKILQEKSTTPGFAVEMGQFVPETLIPMIISAIGTGKGGKLIKALKEGKKVKEAKRADELAKDTKALEGEGKLNKKSDEEVKKVDILDLNFGFRGLEVKINQAHIDIQRLIEYSDETYLFGKKGRIDKFVQTIEDLAFYLENKVGEISNSGLKRDYVVTLKQLSDKIEKISGNKKLPVYLQDELKGIVRDQLFNTRNKL